ncbi:MAG TPA: type II secretion system major pseudopilin GspG [Verrucomicrobiae bacterium]|nr:type II secretion system major pseudopilin GspG [Verrucomicrobiae bacterium]
MKIRIEKNSVPTNKFRRAFTLVEIMLVVIIIGILAALVIPKIAGKSEQARETAAHADIYGGIKTTLDSYEEDNGFYPKSLQDLITKPANAPNWHGPYLDPPVLPVDPWGHPYIYVCPGKHNPTTYDLYSLGPSGKDGNDDNIGNWAN